MKEAEREQDELMRLQRELDSMAAEVPEMPEEFRQGWRRAIREDAANRTAEKENRAEAEQIAAIRDIDINEVKDQETEGKTPAHPGSSVRIRRWTGILSAAAAMVFLIGGTLATRNSLSPRLKKEQPPVLLGSGMSRDVEITVLSTAQPTNSAVPGVSSREMAMDAQEEMEEADSDKSAKTLLTSGEVPLMFSAAAPEETEPEPEEAAGELWDEPAAEEADGNPENLMGEAERPDAGETTDFWKEAGFFLEDMGAFLKAALPYLIGFAAITAVVVLVRKRIKK